MKRIHYRCAGLALAGLLASGAGAGAQQSQGGISEEQVRSFFQQAEQTLTEAVRGGDLQQMVEWTNRNIADGAQFHAGMEVYSDDRRKLFTVASVDKQDLVRMQRIALSAMPNLVGEAIEDFSLDVEVVNVELIGDRAATVTTRISESGTLTSPDVARTGATAGGASPAGATGQQGGQAQGAQTQAQAAAGGALPLGFESTANCTHLVRLGETGGQLSIGLTNCQGRAEI